MINGNMNSVKYIEKLDNNLWQVVAKHFGNTPYLFQDDNAPCHRSRVVEEWKRQNELTQINWPAQSPEKFPIENVWLLMKNKIKNRLYLIRYNGVGIAACMASSSISLCTVALFESPTSLQTSPNT